MYKLSYTIEKKDSIYVLWRWYHLVNGDRIDHYAKKESCGQFDTLEQVDERINYFNQTIDWAGTL